MGGWEHELTRRNLIFPNCYTQKYPDDNVAYMTDTWKKSAPVISAPHAEALYQATMELFYATIECQNNSGALRLAIK